MLLDLIERRFVLFGMLFWPQDLYQVVLIVLTILYQRGFDPLSLVTTSAVLTAVVGLALQSTISNVFAGLALHTDRTVGIGDWVQAIAPHSDRREARRLVQLVELAMRLDGDEGRALAAQRVGRRVVDRVDAVEGPPVGAAPIQHRADGIDLERVVVAHLLRIGTEEDFHAVVS